jgi:hypothetical protein
MWRQRVYFFSQLTQTARDPVMIINGGDTEIARVLPSADEERHAHLATQGLRLFYEVPPMEVMEKALFGASLDDIMNLSEFTGLDR